jgi:hypothetical protein
MKTCDSTCYRARGKNRTRMEQLIAEMRREAIVARFEEQKVVNEHRQKVEDAEEKWYNQPYLYA